jgi:hypothetical protein
LNSKRKAEEKQIDTVPRKIIDIVGHKRISSNSKDDF